VFPFLGVGGLEKKSRSKNAGIALTAAATDEKFVSVKFSIQKSGIAERSKPRRSFFDLAAVSIFVFKTGDKCAQPAVGIFKR
jgi:hypothetical protein